MSGRSTRVARIVGLTCAATLVSGLTVAEFAMFSHVAEADSSGICLGGGSLLPGTCSPEHIPLPDSRPQEPRPPESRPPGPPTTDGPSVPGPPDEPGSRSDGEQPPPRDERIVMTADSLLLQGSRYRGNAERTIGGRTVTTLHFTVARAEMTSLDLGIDPGNGAEYGIRTRPASRSVVHDGPIELYVRDMNATLDVAGYPVLPLRLSPESLMPPDLDAGFLELPMLRMRDVTIHGLAIDGGVLDVPDIVASF